MQDLLQNGARVDSLASASRIFNIRENKWSILEERYGYAINYELRHTDWLPLLFPLLRGHDAVAKLLLEAGATSFLARDGNRLDRGVTAFHLFAAIRGDDLHAARMESVYCMIWDSQQLQINVISPHFGFPAAHVALESMRIDVLQQLIDTSVNIVRGAISSNGTMALMRAVRCHAEAVDHQDRSILFEAAQTLIRRGADVNAAANQRTPLICAIDADVDD